jgi:MFS family permease
MAMTARALQGLGNGNVGILRTTVAELCPWKVCGRDLHLQPSSNRSQELQPRAFSIMPLVYTVGAIFGPVCLSHQSDYWKYADSSRPLVVLCRTL